MITQLAKVSSPDPILIPQAADRTMYLRVYKQFTAQSGFSLVEMAVVLMILGLLLGGVLAAVGDSTNSIRISNTQAELKQIEEALYGYAQANGYLPCPATESSGGYANPPTGNNCTRDHGFVPVATLGLNGSVNADGLLLDAWQNPYRYSVSPAGGGSYYFTSASGMGILYSNASTLLVSTDTTMLRVCNSSNCSSATDIIADTVPAVVMSMGANWADLSAGSSANEQENAFGATLTGSTSGLDYNITNTRDFVDTGYSEVNYDDQLVWLSPYILFSRMIQAGKLP